jgi:hypothetical protein
MAVVLNPSGSMYKNSSFLPLISGSGAGKTEPPMEDEEF